MAHQTAFDEGQGGWFRESRRHSEAAKKGQQDQRRTHPMSSVPMRQRAIDFHAPLVQGISKDRRANPRPYEQTLHLRRGADQKNLDNLELQLRAELGADIQLHLDPKDNTLTIGSLRPIDSLALRKIRCSNQEGFGIVISDKELDPKAKKVPMSYLSSAAREEVIKKANADIEQAKVLENDQTIKEWMNRGIKGTQYAELTGNASDFFYYETVMARLQRPWEEVSRREMDEVMKKNREFLKRDQKPTPNDSKRFLVFCDGVGRYSFDTPEEAKDFAQNRYATQNYYKVTVDDTETDDEIARFG